MNINKKKQILSCFLVFSFFLGLYFRFQLTDYVLIKDWNSRDFDRALNLIDGIYFPLAGPEVNVGGRLPGPFLYYLLAIPLLIHKSYESIFYFNFLLNIGSIVGLYLVLRKYFDHFFLRYLRRISFFMSSPYWGHWTTNKSILSLSFYCIFHLGLF